MIGIGGEFRGDDGGDGFEGDGVGDFGVDGWRLKDVVDATAGGRSGSAGPGR